MDINTEDIIITVDLQQLLTSDQAWHFRVLPRYADAQTLELYADEEHFCNEIKDELEILFNKNIKAELRCATQISKTLGKYYRKNASNGRSVQVPVQKADDFVNQLVLQAKEYGSSDIHIEIYEENARVRYRVDGLLVEKYRLDKNEYPALVNKIKIKANLHIEEKRLPQDGRIFFEHQGKKMDIRVSVLPTLNGEKIVLRLLNNDATNIHIDRLGFNPTELKHYLEGIKKPHGIMLISGPTGSGKTTTLYATLKILNEEKRNILTAEDPIEYTLEGINQVQVKESIGYTFASALRTFLRQDPDVIMLGEIRDAETAQMAIRAALTGHLVLSTIHTNSAWGTVSRLIDMGVQPFLLANTLNTSVAQRLIRKLCSCKKEEAFNDQLFPPAFVAPRKVNTHFVAHGCDECHYTGYKGRKALYEVIPVDHVLAEYIKNNEHQVEPVLKERNIKTLAQNAFEQFEAGLTSIEEVYALLMNH